MLKRSTLLFFLSRESSGISIAMVVALLFATYALILDIEISKALSIPLSVSAHNIMIHLLLVFLSFFIAFIIIDFTFGLIRWRLRTNRSFVFIKTILLTLFVAVFLIIHHVFFSGIATHLLAGKAGKQTFYPYSISLILVFCLTLAFISNYCSYIIRSRGWDFFITSINNKFQKSSKSKRLVMFLDINGSTKLAHKMGSTKYLQLQGDFFKDLELVSYRHMGTIFEYVGDEACLMWPLKLGIMNADAIRIIESLQEQLYKRRDYYNNKYGEVPTFKAALHAGDITTLVSGYNIVDIKYQGKINQVCARLLDKCHELNSILLVSKQAQQLFSHTLGCDFEYLGAFLLKGIESEVMIYRAKI